jgi:hypothetical protein
MSCVCRVELQSGLLIGRRAARKLYMNSNAVQSYESTTVDDNGDNIVPHYAEYYIIFSFCILSLLALLKSDIRNEASLFGFAEILGQSSVVVQLTLVPP